MNEVPVTQWEITRAEFRCFISERENSRVCLENQSWQYAVDVLKRGGRNDYF